MSNYFKFDYFSTSITDLWYGYDRLNLEYYGLTSTEVSHYINQMIKDRERWNEKEKKTQDVGYWIHLFASIFAIPILLIIIKQHVCVLLDVYDEDSIINNLLSIIFFILIGWMEFHIWKNETIINIYNNWIEKKYKKRSQHNPVIEKFLDDANFEHWKYINKLEKIYSK